MLKTILFGVIVAMSSTTAANIMNPVNPISPLNPLSPIYLLDSDNDEKPVVLDRYEKRKVYFFEVKPQTGSYSKVVLYDYKTKKLMEQNACPSVNKKVKKIYNVSYNLTKKYYSLSCEYLK